MAYEVLKNFCTEKLQETKSGKISSFEKFFESFEEIFRREGFRQNFSGAVENILIVRLDAIGDFILTSGFIREVRKNFPSANITLVVSPLVYPIAEICPYANEVLQFDRKMLGKDFFEMLEKIINFCSEKLWRKHFDIAFSPQWESDNYGALWTTYLSGARERSGFGHLTRESYLQKFTDSQIATIKLDNFLLNRKVITPYDVITDTEKNFYILTALGFEVENFDSELWFNSEDLIFAQNVLKNFSDRKKIILGIGAGEDSRKYPVEKLLVALKKIAEKNVVFVIVGGKAEKNSADFLAENLPRSCVLNLAGKTTLRETTAIVSQADFYIGNDSGVMHIAATAKIPVLAIYREPMDKDVFPPLYSEVRRFPPLQTLSVILRPDKSLDDCVDKEIYGGCVHSEAHCITQIDPAEIVEGFEVLENLSEQN